MNYLTFTMGQLPPPPFGTAVERELEARLLPEAGAVGTGALVGRIARALTLAPGARRARPLVVQLVGTSLGADSSRLVELAAGVELIHTASLLHDDVVDESRLRRNLPTANARFGNAAAVLTGDWVLAQGMSALLDYPHALTVYALELVAEMSLGAIGEVESRGVWNLKVDAWQWLAERKCGLLFGFAARAAALVAGQPQSALPLHSAFTRLGVAFQMADDLKDVLDGAAGKDRFADLRNQNPSWALASAVAASPEFGAALADAWAHPGPGEDRWRALETQLIDLCVPLVPVLEQALGGSVAAAGELLGPAAAPSLQAFADFTWGHLPRKAVA